MSKITEIQPQKKNPNRYNIFVDDSFFCGVSTLAIAKYQLYKGKEIENDQLQKISKNEIYLRFLDRATTYIARAVKSEKDVRTYLKQLIFKKKGKWFEEGIDLDFDKLIEKVVTQLKKYKFIDDERYAKLFVESRVRSRPRSKSVLRSELLSKGIDRDTVKSVLESELTDDSQLILSVYSKRFKEAEFALTDRKKVDFLRRKGFNWDEISKLEKRLKDDTQE